jgi:2-dehydro-3-deoxyphosphogluconate aldolase/(4S)-4-hydroxy-2-oxoglutarate aldolase
MNVLELMRVGPVIPVIALEEAAQAVPLARALVAGGVRVLEVTLRTAAALAAIRAIAQDVPEAIVGVGTVTRPEQFAQARDAGALFAVTPGLTGALIEAARASGLLLLPGVMTPSEVIAAHAAGFFQLKLFPAQQAGGLGMLAALQGPFPDAVFCPTGGVTVETAPDFLALPNVVCVGGSWLTPRAALAANDWVAITQLACQATALPRNALDRTRVAV